VVGGVYLYSAPAYKLPSGQLVYPLAVSRVQHSDPLASKLISASTGPATSRRMRAG